MFASALFVFVRRGLICLSGFSSTPHAWKAEARTLSRLGIYFLEGKKALALNLLDKTRDPVLPPTGCVTASSLGLSFLFRKMAITRHVIMRSKRVYIYQTFIESLLCARCEKELDVHCKARRTR